MKIISKILNKKLFILLTSITIGVFGVLSTMLGIYSQKNNIYKFHIDDISDNLVIKEISVGERILNLGNFESKTLVYDKKDGNLNVVRAGTFLKIKASRIENIRVILKSESKNAEIEVYKNNKIVQRIKSNKDLVFSYEDVSRTTDILQSTISILSFKQAIIYFLIFLIISFITYFSC